MNTAQVSQIPTKYNLEDQDRYKRLFHDMSPKLLKKFIKFDSENPEVYTLFERFADEAKASGRERFSHWMIANRIRWYTQVETTGRNFKLTNDYIACYVRKLIFKRPEFEGFFLLKAMKPTRTNIQE